MHDTAALLDEAKSRNAIPSDYKLALVLGIEPSTIGHYRKGRSRPDDVIAQRLAELAGLDVGYVVACMHAERAANDQARGIWTTIAERLREGSAAALAVMVSVGFVAGAPGEARAALASSVSAPSPAQQSTGDGLYIMSTARRRLLRMIGRLADFLTPCLEPVAA